MDLQGLVHISRYYGSNPEILLAGGGNTSCKDKQYLYVKASGCRLADIGSDGFVRLELAALNRIWEKQYPPDTEAREQQALQDLMNARAAGETRRPSVESLLHAALPQVYVVHTHPALVNGLTCGNDGARIAGELFGSRCLWVPYIDPGYTLACSTRAQLAAHAGKHRRLPDILLLANHGMFACGDTVESVMAVHSYVMEILQARATRTHDFTAQAADQDRVDAITGQIKAYPAFVKAHVLFHTNKEIGRFTADAPAFAQVYSAFTPDHIVYAGAESLFCGDVRQLHDDLDAYRQRLGCVPRIIAVKQTGVFAVGDSCNSAQTALLLFLDSIKVAVYAADSGGGHFMNKQQIDFISRWEVEKFRAKMSLDE